MPATTQVQPRTIHRVVEGRLVGGVAAGVAEYLKIDPVIVRAVFVALTLIGGWGLALYLAGWLLIPEEGGDRTVIGGVLGYTGRHGPRAGRAVAGVLVAVAAFSILASRPWRPGWPVGLGSTASGFAIVAIVALLLANRTHHGARGIVWRAVLVFVALSCLLATLAMASVVGLSSSTGVPLRGGIGDRVWQPVSAAELPPAYRLAVGDMRVDLSGVDFAPGETRLRASVGVGRLVVVVPDGLEVGVVARSGAGDAIVFGSRDGGLGARRLTAAARSGPRLLLDARSGIGEVAVVRRRADRSAAGASQR